jgi:hypothetical protein
MVSRTCCVVDYRNGGGSVFACYGSQTRNPAICSKGYEKHNSVVAKFAKRRCLIFPRILIIVL